MKKMIPVILVLALAVLACSININLTPEPGEDGGGGAPTGPTEGGSVPVEPTAEVPAVPTLAPANLTCNQLSLYLDPAIGSSYTCETISEANEADMPPFAINPQYTRVTIQGYPLSGTFFDATLEVYPFTRYRELLPQVSDAYNALSGLIAGGAPGDSSLPFLPYLGAAQVFHAQYAVLNFHNGSGVRYLAEYAQYTVPVNNQDLFYTFQGLTSDGQYWISTRLPVNHPLVQATPDVPAGYTWETFSDQYEAYLVQQVAMLNAQPADSFTPDLTRLDDLIASISITP